MLERSKLLEIIDGTADYYEVKSYLFSSGNEIPFDPRKGLLDDGATIIIR
jgi:hypothetical protein